MAQVLNLTIPHPNSSLNRAELTHSGCSVARSQWSSLQHRFKCNGRVSCLFSDNRREEQARKALESALGGKKSDFEKWDNEIKKKEAEEIKRREAAGGGGGSGGGGWFGWGGRFGWGNGDSFWQETQQAGLAILGIVAMYLIITKGERMLALVLNPLLLALRRVRDGLTFMTTRARRRLSPKTQARFDAAPQKESYSRVSAKEQVLRKWGSN